MKRKLAMFVAAFLIVVSVAAQKPTITFQTKDHDFGNINETDGKVSYVFEFTNTGTATLAIQNVQASCGCTTPSWTKEPIEPGKKGKIVATYDPAGRPNGFNKSISVHSNATNENEVLYIRGNVISKNAPNNFPMQMGALKYGSKNIQMNNVAKGKSQTRSIGIKNTSATEMKVEVAHLPVYVSAVVTPATLKAGEEGKIDFTFNSAKTSVWGPINDDVYITINGKKIISEEYKLALVANVSEDFNSLSTNDKRKAPILELKSPNIYLGQIKKGHIIRGKVIMKNSGINPLEIRRIVNNNAEVTVHPVTSIKGGKEGALKIDINTKSLAIGNYTRVFSMQTNDPQNPVILFNLSWQVK